MGKNEKNTKQFHMSDPAQVKRELKWLWGWLRRNLGRVAAVTLLGLALTVTGLVSGVASKYLIDAVTGRQLTHLVTAAAVMAAAVLGSLALQALSGRVHASVQIKVKNELQQHLFRHILNARWQEVSAWRSGDLLSRLSADVSAAAEGIVAFAPGLLNASAKFLGAFAVMLCFDPVIAIIALVGAPLTVLLSRKLLGTLRQRDLKLKELAGENLSFQEETLGALTEIKAFSAAQTYEEKLGEKLARFQRSFLSLHNLRIGVSVCLSLVSLLVTGACLGWGVYRLWNGAITYGSLLLFLQLASMLRGAFSSLVALLQQGVSICASAGRLMEVEALPEEAAAAPEGFDPAGAYTLILKEISFSYWAEEPVLQQVNLTVAPGELTAVTGASGEGKTTLLRLLLGLVEPSAGEMWLEDGAGKRYAVSPSTRAAFSYVPQDSGILAGTVAENLRLAAPDASDASMRAALKTACVWEFVEKLPGGLDCPIGSGGFGLSQGQAQRIAIARALLRGAPILLLDEATAALDEETERALLENLKNCPGVHSCILVTHRSAAAAVCDSCCRMEAGTLSMES